MNLHPNFPRKPARRMRLVRAPQPHPGDGVLEELPPEEQEVMILASFYGLAKDEIASIIGASVEMVDSLFTHAVEHLRRRLTGLPSGPQAA